MMLLTQFGISLVRLAVLVIVVKIIKESSSLGDLADFGTDLNESAKQGKIDPVIGRDKEISRVIQILSRRTKNNPVLIGEPGVGKTAIAEGWHSVS